MSVSVGSILESELLLLSRRLICPTKRVTLFSPSLLLCPWPQGSGAEPVLPSMELCTLSTGRRTTEPLRRHARPQLRCTSSPVTCWKFANFSLWERFRPLTLDLTPPKGRQRRSSAVSDGILCNVDATSTPMCKEPNMHGLGECKNKSHVCARPDLTAAARSEARWWEKKGRTWDPVENLCTLNVSEPKGLTPSMREWQWGMCGMCKGMYTASSGWPSVC